MAFKHISRWFGGAAVAAAMVWSFSAQAATVPPQLTEQGRILKSDGTPAQGTLSIKFEIFDAATGGNSLWSTTQQVAVDAGYFSWVLGSKTALDPTIFTGKTLYLEVTVSTDPPMTPRQEINSVPYAFMADTANKATSATNANHATTADSASAVAWSDITGIPTGQCTAGQFMTGFDGSGNPKCVAVPKQALSCTIATSTYTTQNYSCRGCGSGQIMTGGGCDSTGTLKTDTPVSSPFFCIVNTNCCSGTYWECSASSGTVTAHTMCCSLK